LFLLKKQIPKMDFITRPVPRLPHLPFLFWPG
jgi:hypothetical protein